MGGGGRGGGGGGQSGIRTPLPLKNIHLCYFFLFLTLHFHHLIMSPILLRPNLRRTQCRNIPVIWGGLFVYILPLFVYILPLLLLLFFDPLIKFPDTPLFKGTWVPRNYTALNVTGHSTKSVRQMFL